MTAVLQNARGGDLQAFEQLVRQHQAEVFGLALQLTGQDSIASELAQDVFVQLHAAIARITSPTHLRHWLLRAVSQQALSQTWQQTDEAESALTNSDPGADFTARVMARVELRWSHRRLDFAPGGIRRQRSRSRDVLIGAAVTGITLVALWWSVYLRKPLTTAISSPHPVINSTAAKAAESPASGSVAKTAATTSSRRAVPRDAYPQYTVIVLPLRHTSLDPGAIAPMEAFHAALVTELRKYPALALLVPGVTAPPDSQQPADYVLTVTSLESRTLPSGGTAFRMDSRGGALSAGSLASGRQWPVEIRIQPIGQMQAEFFASTVQIGEDSSVLPQLAASQVEMLRERIFPDALVKQWLMMRMRDASSSAMVRIRALDDLLGAQRGRGPALTAMDIGVIVAGSATMPADDRAQLWRRLRGTANPELVATMADSLRRDPDLNVRFEALATLAADYGTDPRVRSAIESAAKEDSEQVVRMAARRVLNGDAEWRRYVMSTLKDSSLPLPQRLAPLLIAARSASTPNELLEMRSLVNDEEAVNLLQTVIRDGWFDYTQTETIGDALSLLANSGNPAAPDLLVEIPRESVRPAAPPAMAPAAQISPAAMSWLMKNRSNPRVRRILDDLANGNADPRLGSMVEQMMQQRPPPPR
ncbi:MAG: HEAT repeat domain-containing protein [Pseudomonadota bacterium]